MTKLKLSDFRTIMRRQGFLEKAIVLGKSESSRKKSRIKY